MVSDGKRPLINTALGLSVNLRMFHRARRAIIKEYRVSVTRVLEESGKWFLLSNLLIDRVGFKFVPNKNEISTFPLGLFQIFKSGCCLSTPVYCN